MFGILIIFETIPPMAMQQQRHQQQLLDERLKSARRLICSSSSSRGFSKRSLEEAELGGGVVDPLDPEATKPSTPFLLLRKYA